MTILSFLKPTVRSVKKFSKVDFLFISTIFLHKFFWRKSIKLIMYIIFFKLHIQKSLKAKKSVLIVLKKKKKTYVLFSYFNSKLILSTSLGILLRHFKIKFKYLKRQKKGFQVLLSSFKRIYSKFKSSIFNKSIFSFAERMFVD